MYVEYFKTAKNVLSGAWKAVIDGYFKVHSYLSLVSDFQLHSNFLMAVHMKKFSEIWLQLLRFVHYEIVYFLL